MLLQVDVLAVKLKRQHAFVCVKKSCLADDSYVRPQLDLSCIYITYFS